MANPTILIAIGIVTFSLLYMFFKLSVNASEDNNHFPLQLLLLILILSSFVLIGKVAIDDKDYCSWNVINSTSSGSTTSYVYDYQCITNESTTVFTFYNLILWTFRGVLFYVFIYLVSWVLHYFGMIGQSK